MPGPFISIREVMQHMNNGLPFSLTYVTYNWQKGTGGGVKHVAMATKCHAKVSDDEKPGKSAGAAVLKSVKNPNHFLNSTVNIRVQAAGNADIRKIHIQLIRRFNGFIVK